MQSVTSPDGVSMGKRHIDGSRKSGSGVDHLQSQRALIDAYGGKGSSSSPVSRSQSPQFNVAAAGSCYPQQAAASSSCRNNNNLNHNGGGRVGSSNFQRLFVPTSTRLSSSASGGSAFTHNLPSRANGAMSVASRVPVPPVGVLRPPVNVHNFHPPPVSSAGFRPPMGEHYSHPHPPPPPPVHSTFALHNQRPQSPFIPNGPPPPPYSQGVQNPCHVVFSSKQQPYYGLLTSLLDQGVISFDKAQSPDHLKEASCIGVEFKRDVLKKHHESVISALYGDLPRQCKTCGRRFKCQEEHREHMDWHVIQNRMSKDRHKKRQNLSRKWFLDTSMWHIASTAEAAGPQFMLATKTVVEEKKRDEVVPADENQTSCALCGEPFEEFYSHETEDWMFKDAVYLNSPDHGLTEAMDASELGPIVHVNCRPEGSQRKRLRRN